MSDGPIEDYLDDLLRRTRADARTTRRTLDEAGDHLYAAAGDLQEQGMGRVEAEVEAVRRFGPVDPIAVPAFRQAFADLVRDVVRAGVLLLGCGLAAVGLSGLVVLVMNLAAGDAFVGGSTVVATGGAPTAEVADDAVVLRVLAGLVGVVLLVGYGLLRRRRPRWAARSVLPAGLVDALGAAAFAAATVVLLAVTADQGARSGERGVGFALSGAVVALPAAVLFCLRATRALLPRRDLAPGS